MFFTRDQIKWIAFISPMLGRIDGLMVINVTWQVVSRYIFQVQVRFRMSWRDICDLLGMLGSAYVPQARRKSRD